MQEFMVCKQVPVLFLLPASEEGTVRPRLLQSCWELLKSSVSWRSCLSSGIRVMLVNLQFSVLFGAMSPFPPPPAGAAHLCIPCVPAISRSPWPGELVCSAQTLREGIHRPLVDGASERRGTVSAWQRQVPVHSRAPPGGASRKPPDWSLWSVPLLRTASERAQLSTNSSPRASSGTLTRVACSPLLQLPDLPLQLLVTTVAVVEAGVPKGAQSCCWLCQSQLLQQHRGCCGDGQGGWEARRPAPCRLTFSQASRASLMWAVADTCSTAESRALDRRVTTGGRSLRFHCIQLSSEG